MIKQLAQALKERKNSAEELTRECFAKIKREDKVVHAFLHVAEAEALEAAKRSDARRQKGDAFGLLDGIPIAIKDNLMTKGLPTTAASRMLEGYQAPYDATVVARLKAQGAVIIGKTNLDAWAHGSSTENSDFGPTKNPHDHTRVPGGSSGGSAAAVASGMVPLALGTDTGGSIRQPAAFCGVVGLKPTYGRVSRYGAIAMASSLDQIGPFGTNVADVAIVLETICGHDPLDSTSVPGKTFEARKIYDGGKKKLRLGLPKEYFVEGLAPSVKAAVGAAVECFRREGAIVKEISLPHTAYALPTYYILQPAEVSSNLARYDGLRYGYNAEQHGLAAGTLEELYDLNRGNGFGAEAKRRIMLGTYTLQAGYYDAYYLKAQKVRTLITRDFVDAFREVDFIVTPTTPTPAFKFGEHSKDPLSMYLSDIYTVSANLAGIPALSLPCGKNEEGLPIGLQLLGPHFSEEQILALALRYEAARPRAKGEQ